MLTSHCASFSGSVTHLGWEYPPVVSGGLAVACQHLCDELAKHCRVTMVLPWAEAHDAEDEVSVIGVFQTASLLVDLNDEAQAGEGAYASANCCVSDPEEVLDQILSGEESPHVGLLASPNVYEGELAAKVVSYAASIYAMRERFAQSKVIHCHDWLTMLAGVLLKRCLNIPLVMQIHSTQLDRIGAQARDGIWHLEKWGMRHADVVLAPSDVTAQHLVNDYDIDPQKVRVVPHGVESELSPQWSSREPLVLFVGRLVSQKGPEIMLEVARRLCERHDEVKIMFVGEGEKLSSLRSVVAYAGLRERVFLTGAVKHRYMATLMDRASVLCLPSADEPFGLVVTEAVQHGVAVVMSDRVGAGELMPNALKTPYGEVEPMVDAILGLLQNDRYRETYVRQLWGELQQFTWERAAESVLAVYTAAYQVL